MTLLMTVLAGLNLTACDRLAGPQQNDAAGDAALELVVEPDSAAISVGDTVEFDARVVDQSGSEKSGYTISWSVTDTIAATVDSDGTVVGLAPGNFDVLAEATGVSSTSSSSSLTGASSVGVAPGKVAEVAIEPASPNIGVGDTIQLSATVTNGSGEELDKSVKWSTSDTSVARAEDDGTLIGTGGGAASVVAQAANVSDTTGVTVQSVPVGSVAINPDSVKLSEGGTTDLEAVVRDTSGDRVNRTPSWSSSNTSVATVDATGQVQAQVNGEALIMAQSGSEKDSATVVVTTSTSDTVPSMPSSVSVSEASRTDSSVQYTASWEASDRADSYSWNAGSNNGNWSDSGSGLTSLKVTFTTPRSSSDDDSYFCVEAVNDAGTSEPGCAPFTVPAAGTDTASTAPAAPSGLGVSASSSSSISGSFTDNASNESGFEVYRDDGSGWTLAIELSADDTAFTDTGLSTETTYQYRVRAINSAGTSPYSNVDSATTLSASSGSSSIGTWRGNEPSGYSVMVEDDHDDVNGPFSYQDKDCSYEIAYPAAEVNVADQGADGVFRTIYCTALRDGYDAAGAWTGAPNGETEFYFAFTFYLSGDFQANENMIKHLGWHWQGAPSNTTFLGFKGTGTHTGPVYPMFRFKNPLMDCTPQTPSDFYMSRGEWHQMEGQVAYNDDGTWDLRIWLDGDLAAECLGRSWSGADPNAHPLTEFSYFTTYGGGGTSPDSQSHVDVGHTYISGS